MPQSFTVHLFYSFGYSNLYSYFAFFFLESEGTGRKEPCRPWGGGDFIVLSLKRKEVKISVFY